jgi:hypothetical protein
MRDGLNPRLLQQKLRGYLSSYRPADWRRSFA